jgi:hypothetical protein
MSGKIAKLTYDAAQELLKGLIGTQRFNEVAYSGGSRGHRDGIKPAQAARYRHADLSNDSLGRLSTTREIYSKKTDTYTQRGGTIPPGHYTCVYVAMHHSFGECIRLDQTKDALHIRSPFSRFPISHGRSGFFIPGHGPKGSDGCIVLANEQRRKDLNSAIRGFDGSVLLEVVHVSYMLPAEAGPASGEYVV